MSLVRTVFLVVLLYLWSPLRGAVRDITCPYMSSCVLPCFFDPGPEVVIHWLCPPEETNPVHSYYHKKDQLGHQNPQYKGRTALFKEEISKGNASLMLSRIKVTDSGKYKCYTSTTIGNHEDFINMNVQAPVADVMFLQEGDELMCRSEEVFPKPIITWSPSMHANTTVTETENSLYNIISSVTLSEHTPQDYTCNVSTHYSWKSATYRKNAPINVTGSEVTIHCTNATAPIKILIWKFNNTETILNQTGDSVVISETWKQFVEGVLESGTILLKDLTLNQRGLYSCLLQTDRQKYIINTQLEGQNMTGAGPTDQTKTLIIVAVCLVVVVGLVLMAVYLKKSCNGQEQTDETDNNDVNDKTTQPSNASEVKPLVSNNTEQQQNNGTSVVKYSAYSDQVKLSAEDTQSI